MPLMANAIPCLGYVIICRSKPAWPSGGPDGKRPGRLTVARWRCAGGALGAAGGYHTVRSLPTTSSLATPTDACS
jgi:hypothetical protein